LFALNLSAHARVIWFTHASCGPAGSLAWASDLAGLVGFSAAQKKYKKNKKYAWIYLNLFLFCLFKELESATPFIFVLGYVILTNARVGSIRSGIFTDTRVMNIIRKSS
jgi:hypothetical protein